MAALGDVGATYCRAGWLVSRNAATLAAQTGGNGPISNSAPFTGTPFSTVILTDARGALLERWSFVDAGGLWYFYELSPGTYFATEAGVSRQWRIDVASDLTFTVTPITSTFAGVVGYGCVG